MRSVVRTTRVALGLVHVEHRSSSAASPVAPHWVAPSALQGGDCHEPQVYDGVPSSCSPKFTFGPGGRSSAADLVIALAALFRKRRECRMTTVLMKLDLDKAHDRMPRPVLLTALRERGVPEVHVRFALHSLQCCDYMLKHPDFDITSVLTPNVGTSQGRPDSTDLFAALVSHILAPV
jgi:hypothetical protein